ncbi:MAG: UDP-N-acetylmuramate--L-alanine ligase, partial [Clostridia bacterium]|nr:UDP-N-acetylmuramate--L-alanine ligase [Clostridia bacterium]
LPGGSLIANLDDENLRPVREAFEGPVVTFSMRDSSADLYAVRLPSEDGLPYFEIFFRGTSVGECRLRVPGSHNIMNALAAMAVAALLEVPWDVTLSALSHFEGARRRFEHKGELRGVPVVDDYAHHPSEIRATLTAAREKTRGRVICLFQPHTYSRTKALWAEFVSALGLADIAVLLDVYAAREAADPTVSSAALAKEIPAARYAGSFEEAKALLRGLLQPGDLLLTMGAGDVFKVGEQLLQEEAVPAAL